MNIREQSEEVEKKILSPYAALSGETKGRMVYEEPCYIRTDYQRDRDRIIHSK
jgi:dGTPase